MNASGWQLRVAGLVLGPLACRPAAPVAAPAPPEVAAEKVTFGTLQDLGGFVFQSSTHDERIVAGKSIVHETAVSLKWKDRDHWDYETLNDGRPTTHWLVVDANAWQGLSGGGLKPKGDPEPLRAQLSLGWDPWEDLVAITGGRIALGPGVTESVDGRIAVRHDVSLQPQVGSAAPHRALGSAMEPDSLTGTVWIDQETAVRVLADITVRSSTPGDASRSRTLNVKLAVTGLGQDPGVAVPPGVSPSPGVP